MTQRVIHVPSLYGGISQQAAHVRFPNQVEDATNARFSVVDGASIRPGTELVGEVSGLTDGQDYRLHAVNRDDDTKYLIIYGGTTFTIKAMDTDGSALTVNIDAAALTYLQSNSPNDDQIALATNQDYTLIANKTVSVASKASDTYTVTDVWEDFDSLLSQNPDADTYHRTQSGTETQTKGYYQYDPGDGTFAEWISDAMDSTWNAPTDNWDDDADNPMGFGIRFKRFDASVSSGSWTASTKRLVKAGAFANYTTEENDDYLNVTGGTNVVAGQYLIASKISDDEVELDEDITSPSGDQTDVTASGIEKRYEAKWEFISTPSSMEAIATRITQALRDAGARDGMCSWVPTSSNNGKFLITSPYKGSQATVAGMFTPSDSNVNDLTNASTDPFYFADGTATAGTGSPASDTKSVLDRWTRVAAPGDEDALPDNTTMPVKAVLSGSTITVSLITWDARETGDKLTNPTPSLWVNSRNIADIAWHRDRLVLAGDENVVMSQAGDFFNFFIEDDTNVVDSDPIDLTIASDRVTLIDFIVPFRKSLLIFTKAGAQFELNAPESLTPSTAAITPGTAYQSQSVDPDVLGNFVYFIGTLEDSTLLYEYYYDDSRVSNTAADVSAHVPELLPMNVRRVVAAPNSNTVIVLPVDGYKLYVYRMHWAGNQKEQSAWSVYEIDSSDVIKDIAVIDNTLYLLVNTESTFVLESMPLAPDQADTGYPYAIRLDRRQELTGSYDGGADETTWTLPFADSTIDTAILGPDFTSPGTEVAVTVTSTSAKASGDYTDGECILGRAYSYEIQPTRPYVKNFNGIADVDAWVTLRQFTVSHINSGNYTLKATRTNRTDRTKSHTVSGTGLNARGHTKAWFTGNAEDTDLLITATSPKPVTIVSLEYNVDYEARRPG